MISKQYYLFFSVLIFFSFFSYTYYNLLPSNILFEVLVFSSFFLVAKRVKTRALVMIVFSFVYVLYTFGIGYLSGVHVKDYFLAYKAFLYLIILGFFSGKSLFPTNQIRYFFYLILFAFLLKYLSWLVIADFNRPGLFTENNFELMFLLFISLAVYVSTGSLNKVEVSTLILIFFLSGSRSGILCLFAMFCILYIRRFDLKTILQFTMLVILGVGVGAVFISRLAGGGIESIDRFVFMQGFILAVTDWGVVDYLVGSKTLTALPVVVCERLSFYETLFSASDPNVCYSAILHSFILRVIFDHGIIGFLFIFYSIWIYMKKSLIPTRVSISVLIILFLNGLSVSSINSVYAMIGLMILLSVEKYNSQESERGTYAN